MVKTPDLIALQINLKDSEMYTNYMTDSHQEMLIDSLNASQ